MRRAHAAFVLLFATTAALAVEPNVPDRSERGELRHVVLQASGPLTPADRDELAAKGLVVQRAIPGGRYLARVAPGRVIDDLRVQSIVPIEAREKIASSAVREATTGKTWAEVNVYFHDDVTVEEARSALLSAGAALDDPFVVEFSPANRLSVKIAPSALERLAADDRVLSVTGPIRFRIVTDNAKSAALSHVPELYVAPYGLSGAGVTASLFELAAGQADHVEFGGRLTVMATGGSSGDARHATHVAGTIGAAGVNPDAKGMAPQARIVQLCVRTGSNTCRNDYLKDKKDELIKIGSHVDNNSWGYQLGWNKEDYWVWNAGDDYFGAYELEITSTIDQIALDRGILFVHSAGNEGSTPSLGDWGQHRHVDDNLNTITDKLWCYSADGSGTDCPTATCTGSPTPCEKGKHHPQSPYDTLGFTASGKNTIAVGALQELASLLDVASFSSRGPAKDGRVKPDVVARGYGVLSSVPVNTYGLLNGTSMAAPAVTGISVLLVEQWRKTFGTDPDAVQLKAVLIAGADDLGRPGPDYTFGFGLVNAKTSADLIRDDLGTGQRIRSVTVGQAQSAEFPIVVSAPQNVRVVLQWGDPSIPLVPGQWIADKALVNDLDLKVVGPDGTEHLPYVLDKAQVEANATTGVNTVDNTEEVEIRNAPAGAYRVVVSGRNVPQGPQRAVVVSSVRTAAPCVDLTESKNNSTTDPYGDLTANQTVFAALCSQNDVDLFRWTTMPGPVSVTVTTGEVAATVTLSGAVNATVTVPANATRTLSGTYSGSGPAAVTMRVEPSGTIGAEPFYRFTPAFTPQSGPRRRSARH